MSKGSGRRPTLIPVEEFSDNWSRIFRKKEKPEDVAQRQKDLLDAWKLEGGVHRTDH